ncbi:MAG: exodeoxyribonuclease III [Lysobacterales bacterium]|jgi:exodeoxyribonuclease-3|nr:MAG: exodeoxyribonuclease III [Xanthomonadales bacterium]
MRVTTFNANGLRSAAAKGFFAWWRKLDAELLCLQETRASTAEVEALVTHHLPGYRVFHRPAETRTGYSGVAIACRREPDRVIGELGWPEFDREGRYLELCFGALRVISLYLPSGSSSPERQAFKFQVMHFLESVWSEWLASGRPMIVAGDLNIVRGPKDIRNFRANQKHSGCLPEERAWLNARIEEGWIDTYRALRPEGEEYTWWSQRGQARSKDVGWRIDYQLVSPKLSGRLLDCSIAPRELRFSDHAPYTVDYRDDG